LLQSNLSGLDDAGLPVTEPAKSTVEQIAVDPSTLNTARTTDKEKKELAALEALSNSLPTTKIGPFDSPREGDTNTPKTHRTKKYSCQRSGCFVSWNFDPRIPHKKLCSSLCDNALRAACARMSRYYKTQGAIGRITSANRMNVLLAKPGSRAQLRAFQSIVLRC